MIGIFSPYIANGKVLQQSYFLLTGHIVCRILDATQLKMTTKTLIPHGPCRVYEGRSMAYMRFSITDKEEGIYYVFISDASAVSSFQVLSPIKIKNCTKV